MARVLRHERRLELAQASVLEIDGDRGPLAATQIGWAPTPPGSTDRAATVGRALDALWQQGIDPPACSRSGTGSSTVCPLSPTDAGR